MKSTRSIVGFVALGSMIAGNPIIAKAEDVEKVQDLTVNIETSKEEYSKEEDIDLDLNFINNSEEFNLKDVDITGTNVGDKYVLEGNTKINLEVGEQKSVKGVVLRSIKAEPVNPPSTGDEDSLMVVGVITVGSALCVALAKKNKKGLMATVVLGAIVATGIAGSGLTAYAEEVETKQESVIVTKEVIVDGQPLAIELTIGYVKEEVTPTQDPVVDPVVDPTEELKILNEEKENLMRDYFNGKITQEDYQVKLDEMYEKQKELDAKKELEELPRTEDGKIDCSSIDPEKIKSLDALDAYLNQDKLDFEEAYKNGIIDENFYNAEMNWIVSYREQFISSKTDSSELQQQEEESLKQKMEQERIEAEQKAEEERQKQEEIKARGELYNLNLDDFLDLWYNIRYNGNTSYTEDQMKVEIVYRWKEGGYMPSFKTEEEVYNGIDSLLRSRYNQENPYAECVNNKYTIELLQPDQNIINKIDYNATRIFKRALGIRPWHSIVTDNTSDYIRTNYMRNLDVAIYNYAYAGVKDERAIGVYQTESNNGEVVKDLVSQDFLISKDGFPTESDSSHDGGWMFDFINIISPQRIDGVVYTEFYLIDNGNNTYTIRLFGYR